MSAVDRSSDHWKSSIVMRSDSPTPAARWAASNTADQSGRGSPGSGASIGPRICPAAREERASARVRSWPREKGRRISGSYAETATRSARTSLEASSISLLLPTPGSPSTITAVGRRSPGARATAARTNSSSCVRPKNPVTAATLPVPRSRLDPREVPHDTRRRHPYRPSHRCGPGNGPGPEEGGAMRGFHCVDPSHGRIDFTGADDEELFEHIKAHTAEAHPDLTDSQVRDMMAGADWWRSMATSGQNSGSSPSAYDK